MPPKNDEKIRWTQVGVLFENMFRHGEMSGTVNFGLLGEVKVWAKPGNSRAGKPYWTLICRTDDLPTLLILDALAKREPPPAESSPSYEALIDSWADQFVEPEDQEEVSWAP